MGEASCRPELAASLPTIRDTEMAPLRRLRDTSRPGGLRWRTVMQRLAAGCIMRTHLFIPIKG